MPDPRPHHLIRLPHVLIALGLGLIAVIPPARHALGTGALLLASGQLAQFQQHLRSLGAWAPVVSIALMIAEALIVPLPATIILIANGLVFGLWMGTLVSLTGGMLGSSAAYAIGRYFGRDVLERLLPAGRLKQADGIMEKYGAWAVVVAHFIPGVPGDPMGYASGVTKMPFLKFFVLTAIGVVPSNFVAAYVGVEIAGDVPLVYWLVGWGVVAIGYIVWRQRKR